MVSESSYPIMGNLVNFEQIYLLRASKKYLENTANGTFNKVYNRMATFSFLKVALYSLWKPH